MRPLLPVVLILMPLSAWPAKAELSISGEADDVKVEAKDATFSEVVDGIVSQTGVQITVEGSDVPTIDGDFRGPVEDVLTEMLRNTSFLISPGDDSDQPGLHVVILGPAVEPVAPPQPEADNPDMRPPPDLPGDQSAPPPEPARAPPNRQPPAKQPGL